MAGPGTPGAESSRTESPRERYRSQVRAEVKERAWEQMAEAGASALSLNAIAKQMGMSGPALYRYFASRDDLITALIRDAYRGLADTVRLAYGSGDGEPAGSGAGSGGGPGADASREAGRASHGAEDATAPLARIAHALRGWALADPQRYFLVYGTPVPGYHAPEDITAIADEIMRTLLDACPAPPADRPATPFETHLADHRQWAAGHPAPPAALRRALSFWTRLHGVLSLELAGHFDGMGLDPDRLFAAELDGLLAP
ncbi:TetR/AcrR family transcriptional regulator [Streptomyces physcomitrii]|uniref:TetR/AcrR family transcriptional regulator n=1 Tax=Streptomyces physcomitrii TaxID=2724184 RepID=UPI003431698B